MKLLLIGCGRLGQLFLERWAQNSEIKEIWVTQPSLAAQSSFLKYTHIHFVKSMFHLPENFFRKSLLLQLNLSKLPMLCVIIKFIKSILFLFH